MLFVFLRCLGLSSDWLLHKCLPQRSVPPCGVRGLGEEHIRGFHISSFSKRPFQRRIPLLAGGDGGPAKVHRQSQEVLSQRPRAPPRVHVQSGSANARHVAS